VLFGDYSPAGRLPITFPRNLADVPEFTDYRMKGRTYRYAEKEPLYPFGYGLSYTRFEYVDMKVDKNEIERGESIKVSAIVKNVGERTGDEVVQLYVKALDAPFVVPVHELRGFERFSIEAGKAARVSFTLDTRDLTLIDEGGKRVYQPGRFRIYLGGNQPDSRSVDLIGEDPQWIEVMLRGDRVELEY
jgi:beta-glucosidase